MTDDPRGVADAGDVVGASRASASAEVPWPCDPHQKILILDFGSQYTQLIARRVREAGRLLRDPSLRRRRRSSSATSRRAGIILSGGPSSVYEERRRRAPQVVFELGVPVLGICYGMQTMAAQLGGAVEAGDQARVRLRRGARARPLGAAAAASQDRANAEGHGLLDVWMSHGDKVTALPPGFKVMAATTDCPIAGMADEARRFYGVQFHPEVTHTLQGSAILAALRARHLRLRRRLEHAGLRRRGGRARCARRSAATR
ncbi:MAG: glutamine-hydrolyzing GMP synthase [Comamonadaceae bacterium]|nr:glutamine-hydrolyzing GMP synthase [Comamonadaceae bacterium]